MNDYIIATDSAANLPADFIQKHNLPVMPLIYLLNGEEFYSGAADDIPLKEFYAQLRNGAKAGTSAVNVDDITRYMDEILKTGVDIFYIAFSSALSCTYENAVKSAETLRPKYPNQKILVLDSLCASLGEGLLVTYAVMQKEGGAALEQVYQYTSDLRLKVCHEFTVDDLMFLKRGGRLSGGVAIIGSILKIKPVLHVDNLGRLISKGMVFGRKASIKALYKKYVEKAENKPNQIVYIVHGDCIEDAESLKEMILSAGAKEVFIGDLDQVIGSHSGPGTLALFYIGQVR